MERCWKKSEGKNGRANNPANKHLFIPFKDKSILEGKLWEKGKTNHQLYMLACDDQDRIKTAKKFHTSGGK